MAVFLLLVIVGILLAVFFPDFLSGLVTFILYMILFIFLGFIFFMIASN